MDLYWLYEVPLWVDMGVFLLVLFVPLEIGLRIGLRKRRANQNAEPAEGSDATFASILALLGLMLAFTYAFCMSRADLRKQSLIIEVNAIGTAFLRADLADEPGRTALRQRLLEYARSRLVTRETAANREQLRKVVERSMEAQAKIWPATKSVLQQKGGMSEPLKASLLQAVNEVLDAHTRRLALVYDRLPSGVFGLLMLISAVSMAFAGYGTGLSGHTHRWRISTFAVILAALMLLILDFDTGLRGFVQINQESLVSLIREMETSLLH